MNPPSPAPPIGPSPSECPPPTRRHLNFPGALLNGIQQRIAELDSGTFSRFAVELVCYDLRVRRRHSITRPVADEPEGVQEAIDHWIVRSYQPGAERNGDAIRSLMREATADARQRCSIPASAVLMKQDEWVLFPGLLQEAIEIRWRELDFKNISQYVTSLIRYDLLLSGPHKYFRGDDCSPEMLAALDRETLALFHENAQPEILADRIMAEEAGMPLTREESCRLMEIAADQLRKRATGR